MCVCVCVCGCVGVCVCVGVLSWTAYDNKPLELSRGFVVVMGVLGMGNRH